MCITQKLKVVEDSIKILQGVKNLQALRLTKTAELSVQFKLCALSFHRLLPLSIACF